VDFGLAALTLHFLVEALAGFVAQPLVFAHFLHEIGQHEYVLGLVVRQALGQAIGHVDGGIQAHHVGRAQRGRLRVANHRAGQLVGFFHGQAQLLHGLHGVEQSKHAHAVGDKAGGILSQNHRFAQVQIAVVLQESQHVGVGVRRRDYFQQLQVARRVEEVRAGKVLLEILGAAIGQQVNRDA